MKHTTGYHVWIYGDCYWHRTLEGAGRRLRHSLWVYDAEHAQCIEVATGANMTPHAWCGSVKPCETCTGRQWK